MLIFILILLGVIVLFIRFPYVRILITKFPIWFGLTLKDIYYWFKDRKYFVCPSGKIIAFCGLFGKGKTLSMVHYVCRLYKRIFFNISIINIHVHLPRIFFLASNIALLVLIPQ